MKRMLLLLAVALVAGCASVVKVEGDHVINNRLGVKFGDAWNKIPTSGQPFEMWTQEGPGLDQLRFWAGVRPGDALTAAPSFVPAGQTPPRVPTFTAGMTPDQIVSLFETVYAADGSLVKVTRLEPAPFAATPGVRFEFTVTRKRDDLLLRGVGWAAVRGNALYAATFVAPHLALYRRLLPKAENVVLSAQVKV